MSNHDPYSDSPSLLVGFSITNSTRAWEPTLSCNQLHSLTTSRPMSTRVIFHYAEGYVT